MNSILRAGISSLVLLIAAGCSDNADIAKELAGRVSLGDLGTAPCANVDLRIERIPQIAGVEPDFLPGAGRVRRFIDLSVSDNRFDRPALEVLTSAGFLAAKEGLVDGKKAKEFELTPKGYLALQPGKSQCFVFQKMERAEVLKVDSAAAPDGAFGGAKVVRVTYRAHYQTVAPWAKTDEFAAVFRPKDSRANILAESNAVGEDQSVLMVKMNGKWWLDNEASAMLQLAKLPPEQAANQQKYVEMIHPAARSVFLAKDLRPLVDDMVAKTGDACFSLNQRAVLIRRNKDSSAPLQLYVVAKHGTGTSPEERLQAADFMARIKAAGLVVREMVDGDAGTLYDLHDSLRDAYSNNSDCLSVGKPKIVEVALFQPERGGVVPYRAWLKIADPPAHATALAKHFPHLQTMIETGYGVGGRVTPISEQNSAQSDQPKFSSLAALEPMAAAAVPATATDGGASSKAVPTAPLRFTSHDGRCVIPPGGNEVSNRSVNSSCSYVTTAPRIASGRVYVEIKVTVTSGENQLGSWTKLSLVNERAPGKLPRVGADHALAGGTHAHARQLKSGDVLGVAIDQGEGLAYVHLNGAWQTGRPGSGVGLTLSDGETFFTAVVSEGEKFAMLPEQSLAYPVPTGYMVGKTPVAP